MLTATFSVAQSLAWAVKERWLDFHIFYVSATASGDPYATALTENLSPNTNPPAFLWLLQPLGWLPENAAFVLWTAAGTLSLVASARLVGRALRIGTFDLLVVTLSTQAAAMSLRLGQIGLLLTWPMTVAWLADRAGHSSRAGAWMGGLIYLKPFIGLYALYFIARRDWRAVISLAASLAACFLVGVVAYGAEGMTSWFRTIGQMSVMAPHVLNASLRGVTSRLFTTDRPQPMPVYESLGHYTIFEGIAWGVLVLTVLCISVARMIQRDRDSQWAILATTSLLVSPLGWIYYLPMWLGPLAAAGNRRAIVFSLLLLGVPAAVLVEGRFSPLLTITVGSLYTWALVGLWLGVLAKERSVPTLYGRRGTGGTPGDSRAD